MGNPMVNFKDEIRWDMENMNSSDNVLPQFKNMSREDRKQYCDNDRLPYDVCLLNITGDMNHGVMVRTFANLGASKIIVAGRNRLDRRTLVGVEFYQDIEYVGGLNQDTLEIDLDVFRTILRSNQYYFPVFVEQGGTMLGEVNWKNAIGMDKRPLLIFGNEGRGIQDSILDLRNEIASMTVSIPQLGVSRSYNVSAAASIVGFHFVNSVGWL